MFPTASSSVYYNDAGEPLGWNNDSSFEPPEYDDCCEGPWNGPSYDEDDDE